MKKIQNKQSEHFTYDPHMLDGIEFVDDASALQFIKSLVSVNMYDKRSPYVAVRALIKFFDKDTGVLRHGLAGTAALMKYLNRKEDVRKSILSLSVKHAQLVDLIYRQKDYRGHQLVERVQWKLNAIVEDVRTVLKALRQSDFVSLFGNTTAVKGRPNGKLVGLEELTTRAAKKLNEITDQIGRLERIMRKGKDPLRYACVPAYKIR